jgi:acetyl esterase/lipase
VVIFPGGGYGFLASQHEGVEYAEWLNERGITAMVVKYRVSGRDALGYHWPVPYLDARRAIRTLRAMSRNLGITSVGVMGSSAGGHLASLCATHFEATFPEEAGDSLENVSCRPDFAILIYPVISMGEVAHEGSRRRLAGPDPSPERLEFLSTELQVGKDSPPCFLLSTFDDGVDCRNSLKFAAACKASGVPVVLHLFEKGGHGYGLRGEGDVAGWPGLLGRWLQLRAGKASSSKK